MLNINMIVINIIILLNFQIGADYLPTWPHKWWETQILAWPPTSEHLSGLAISGFPTTLPPPSWSLRCSTAL